MCKCIIPKHIEKKLYSVNIVVDLVLLIFDDYLMIVIIAVVIINHVHNH